MRFTLLNESRSLSYCTCSCLQASVLLSDLYAAHQKGQPNTGVDIEEEKGQILGLPYLFIHFYLFSVNTTQQTLQIRRLNAPLG